MKESYIVKAVLKHLKSVPGCFCWKEHGGMYGTAGIPDIIACIGGRFFAFEVKTESGRVTKLQEATIRKILAAGGIASVVRSVAEVQAVIEDALHRDKDCKGTIYSKEEIPDELDERIG